MVHPLKLPFKRHSEYSRCGRTDRGVSALGNVIGIKLRAKKPNDKGKQDQNSKEMDYVKMINGCLPEDIRILSCVEVPDNFNARYSKIIET